MVVSSVTQALSREVRRLGIPRDSKCTRSHSWDTAFASRSQGPEHHFCAPGQVTWRRTPTDTNG